MVETTNISKTKNSLALLVLFLSKSLFVVSHSLSISLPHHLLFSSIILFLTLFQHLWGFNCPWWWHIMRQTMKHRHLNSEALCNLQPLARFTGVPLRCSDQSYPTLEASNLQRASAAWPWWGGPGRAPFCVLLDPSKPPRSTQAAEQLRTERSPSHLSPPASP